MALATDPVVLDKTMKDLIEVVKEQNRILSESRENPAAEAAGVMFTAAEATGTRLGAAESMVWEKSTDIAAGRDDFPAKFNCFNTYEALVKGGKVVATEGSYEFEQYKDDDEYDADVFVMFQKGYGRRYYDGNGNEYRYVSDRRLWLRSVPAALCGGH